MARAMKTRRAATSAKMREQTPQPSRKSSADAVAQTIQPGGNSSWSIRSTGGQQILQARLLTDLPWLVHGFSTRPGGTSDLNGKRVLNLGFTDWDRRQPVEANRAAFVAALPAGGMPLIAMRQIHSDVVLITPAVPESPQTGDALATKTPNLLLGVQTADCVPILLADLRNRAVAAVHAGWRGTLARIVVKTLGRMQMEFGTQPKDVVAALGPAVGRCCYEVGAEVAQAFATQFPAAWD